MIKDETLHTPPDRKIPKQSFSKQFETHRVPRNERKVELWRKEHRDIVWYTDGLETENGTGAGINGVNPKRSMSLSLGKHGTVFQAEIIPSYYSVPTGNYRDGAPRWDYLYFFRQPSGNISA